tara:strand:+ start:474 stop:842 length:369 start_codon:yes stop_codon:yes gene_type:complete
MEKPSKEKQEALYRKKLSPVFKRQLKQKVKAQDFIGHRYKIVWKKPSKALAGGEAWGLCEDNSAPEKTIHIDPNLPEYDFLTTCLDESIHACNFSLDNDHVGEMADSMAYFLWRIGFRIVKE